MTPRAVVVGPSAWNTTIRVPHLPPPVSHMVQAEGYARVLGGTSAGKALHLADAGVATSLFTAVGTDADAELILGALARPRGRDSARQDSPASLTVTPWVVPGPSEHHVNLMTSAGERLSLYLDGPPHPVLTRRDRIAVHAAMATARTIVLDLCEMGRELLGEAAATEANVWADLHDYDGANPFHAPFAATAHVVVMNDDGCDDPLEVLHLLVARGARAAVCTRGARGAVGVASDGTEVQVPAAPVTVRDTNGAGDAFVAGMIAASHAQGWRAGAGGKARRGGTAVDATTLAGWMRAGASQAVRALQSDDVGPAPAVNARH